MDRHVIVHTLGHRDLYLGLADRWYRPVSHGQRPTGLALQSLTEAQLRPQPPAVAALATPHALGWSQGILKRRLEAAPGAAGPQGEAAVTRLAVPLVAAAIAEARRQTPDAALHLILVSSHTAPADSPDGTQVGKSTTALARVVETALRVLEPGLEIHPIHRETPDAFQFADLPETIARIDDTVAALRRPVVDEAGEAWSSHFRVSLSASTGTVALRAALQSGLRPHRAQLIHLAWAYRWPFDEAGTLGPLVAQSLDPDQLAQRPARPLTELPPAVRRAVEEMRAWRAEYVERRPRRAADEEDAEARFWFRKGRKEVLAVLVTGPDGALRPHRALNLEVSLPTGTLCAERNAIGSALAAQPDLRRADLRAVAVLSLDAALGPRLGPCGACGEWLRKVAEVNPDFRIVTFGDLACTEIYVEPVG